MTSHPQHWNQALLSVYYYGRQDEAPLRGQPPPLGVWPLARAISVLSTAPVGPHRLALGDLCRTRAKRSTPTVVTQMRKLAVSYQSLTRDRQRGTSGQQPGTRGQQPGTITAAPPRTAVDVVAGFEQIFAQPVAPDDAYLKAIDLMLRNEIPPPPGSNLPVLTSYSVSAQ
jgi:hypothetical protein